jgi:hypothetical protein
MLHDDETLTDAGEICKRADARRFLHSVLERPRQIAGRIFFPADHQSARIGSNYFQSLSLGERATDEKQFCLRTGNLRNLNFDLAATGAACLLKVNTPCADAIAVIIIVVASVCASQPAVFAFGGIN